MFRRLGWEAVSSGGYDHFRQNNLERHYYASQIDLITFDRRPRHEGQQHKTEAQLFKSPVLKIPFRKFIRGTMKACDS